MVFPGKQSTGCGLCRARKVKCDEARPTCRRCASYGVECPGYERPLTFRFHSGSRRCKQPSSKSPRSPAKQPSSKSPSSPAKTSQAPAPAIPPETPAQVNTAQSSVSSSCLARQPRPSLEEQAVAFFFHENYVAPEPGVSSGHLDFLLELYGSSCKTSCLRPSTLAASYLSLSRHHRSTPLYLEARRHYGQALRSVNSSLSKKDEQKDVILSAIMLLSLIEDIDGEVPGVISPHLRGISRLFETEGYSLLYDLQQGSLCRWVFTQLTIYSFVTNRSLPCLSLPEIEEMERNILHPTYGTILAAAKISGFYSAATRCLKAWSDNSTTSAAGDRASTLSVIDEAMRLQTDLMFWARYLPESARPRYITTADGRLLITHSSKWLGSVWSVYLSSLILFYSKVMSCCQVMLDTDRGESPTETGRVSAAAALAKKSIVELVGTICAGVPYLFGEVDEDGEPSENPDRKASILYNMVWPLAIIRRCRFSTESQVSLCGESLSCVGKTYGLNLAYSAEGVLAEALKDVL